MVLGLGILLKPTTKPTLLNTYAKVTRKSLGAHPPDTEKQRGGAIVVPHFSFTFQNTGVSFKICHSLQPRSAGHRAHHQKTNSPSPAERSYSSKNKQFSSTWGRLWSPASLRHRKIQPESVNVQNI